MNGLVVYNGRAATGGGGEGEGGPWDLLTLWYRRNPSVSFSRVGLVGVLMAEAELWKRRGLSGVVPAIWRTRTVPPDWTWPLITRIGLTDGEQLGRGNSRRTSLQSNCVSVPSRDHLISALLLRILDLDPRNSIMDLILVLRSRAERRLIHHKLPAVCVHPRT